MNYQRPGRERDGGLQLLHSQNSYCTEQAQTTFEGLFSLTTFNGKTSLSLDALTVYSFANFNNPLKLHYALLQKQFLSK